MPLQHRYGLLIYQTGPDTVGFHFFDGTRWNLIISNNNVDTMAWKTGGNAGTTAELISSVPLIIKPWWLKQITWKDCGLPPTTKWVSVLLHQLFWICKTGSGCWRDSVCLQTCLFEMLRTVPVMHRAWCSSMQGVHLPVRLLWTATLPDHRVCYHGLHETTRMEWCRNGCIRRRAPLPGQGVGPYSVRRWWRYCNYGYRMTLKNNGYLGIGTAA